MRVRITKSGIFGRSGAVPVGTEFTVKEEPKGWLGRYEVVRGAGSTEGKVAVTNEGGSEEYKVAAKGRGWFVVMKGDEEVTKSLRSDDVQGFEYLPEAEQAAFVEENRAEG
ncbi:MAG: hypothetical protein AAF449_03945 [Myxococcota bacterium]